SKAKMKPAKDHSIAGSSEALVIAKGRSANPCVGPEELIVVMIRNAADLSVTQLAFARRV
ncbi:hypothetical protein BGX33_008117, partial [Mortierella sp. NVP41]